MPGCEDDGEECGSSDEDIESGAFFKSIEKEQKRAKHEREYLMKQLKAKSRVGSIFFDKPKRVLTAV